MAFIDGTVINVAAPKFQSAFRATVIDVQWVIESYGIFLSSLILVGGALGDRFGRRLVFLIGVVMWRFSPWPPQPVVWRQAFVC